MPHAGDERPGDRGVVLLHLVGKLSSSLSHRLDALTGREAGLGISQERLLGQSVDHDLHLLARRDLIPTAADVLLVKLHTTARPPTGRSA